MSHLVSRRVLASILVLGLQAAGLAPASAADPIQVTITTTPNPSYETEPFTIVVTADPHPDAMFIRIQKQTDGGPWGTVADLEPDPSGTTSARAGIGMHWQTHVYRAQVLASGGVVLATSEPIDHVVMLRETYARLTIDASSYPFRGTVRARVRIPDIGMESFVHVGIQRPHILSFPANAPRVRTTAGQTEAEIEVPIDASYTPGSYVAVASFSGGGSWGNAWSERIPIQVEEIRTSVALSTPRTPTGPLEDFTVTARVSGPDGSAIPNGTVRFTIDGQVAEPVSVSAGVATFVVNHNVRQRMGQFGIAIEGRHEIRGAYSFRANGGYGPSTSPVLVHHIGTVDTIPPTVTTPSIEIEAVPISAGKVPIKVTWSGNDGQSGIARYELQANRNETGWGAVAVADGATLLRAEIVAGDRYQYRVRATDRAGNRGAWVSGPSVRPTLVKESGTGAVFSSGWADRSASRYLDGVARVATAAGSQVTYTFTGRSVAWLGVRGPDQGVAKVYLDGVEVWTVDMVHANASGPRVAFAWKWKDVRQHVLRIVVAGTSGRPAVTVDGFAVLRD